MMDNDPYWYKDAILYEVHVRAFHDSLGDGRGDFRGLTQKLNYLEDLGITAVWLLPFYPSPLRDDGYDIADYTDVHPHYGRLEDFQEFLNEAHRRGIRVITELVINHTSDQHPWFQRARVSPPGSSERDFYVWSHTAERYKEARIIFKDFERSNWTWDSVAGGYYWHRFYSHQPDLNYDNPAVKAAILPVLDFWLNMGVDGMRLDAVPYLFEREGTNCENLPETHAFLKELRAHVDSRFPQRMFLAEANQWPEDAAAYFGSGDECQMAFHFPIMPRLFMALQQEDSFPILDILAQTPAIPENCQWCLFLRNHDELTLEMVTDEERDYMYRAYASDQQARLNLGIRRRLAPLLRNDRRRIELMNALLFSLPGTPVIYYGDEIGMGDNIYLGDRNGVRTPMQWSADRNAGFSRCNPQKLYLPVSIDPEYHYEASNVEAQQNNPSSLLWWTKRLIALRKKHKAFGRGSLKMLRLRNPKILAFVRSFGDENILVVANLSRFVQHVELDLHEYRDSRVEEMFSRAGFPSIGEHNYPLTLGPHGFYWFLLNPVRPGQRGHPSGGSSAELPQVAPGGSWEQVFRNSAKERLEALLPEFLARRRMMSLPGIIRNTRIGDVMAAGVDSVDARLLNVRVEYENGDTETTILPLARVPEDQIGQLIEPVLAAALVRLAGTPPAVLCDALTLPAFCNSVLQSIGAARRAQMGNGQIVAVPLPGFAETCGPDVPPSELTPVPNLGERNNASIFFGQRAIYKSFRRLETGVNPDLEMSRYLTERQHAEWSTPLLGYVEYRRHYTEPTTLAVLHRFVPNQGDAWQLTLDQLSRYFERVLSLSPERRRQPPPATGRLLNAAPDTREEHELAELIGPHLGTARKLGERTADLHQALAAEWHDPAFVPEPFGRYYQRSLYQSMRNLTGRILRLVSQRLGELEETTQALARQLVEREERILGRFRAVLDPDIGGLRMRCHGDYHLRQLLNTGSDFVIVGFEGNVARPVADRRVKRSALQDVADLVHSIQYATTAAIHGLSSPQGQAPGMVRPEDRPDLEPWAAAWCGRVAQEFVASYCERMKSTGVLPDSGHARRALLRAFLLDRALRDVEEEFRVRRDWVYVALDTALRSVDEDL
jgi:maltose alpha-D-glucosyltransferase/alpha-amylase